MIKPWPPNNSGIDPLYLFILLGQIDKHSCKIKQILILEFTQMLKYYCLLYIQKESSGLHVYIIKSYTSIMSKTLFCI